jgi:hypothetical protein
LVFSHGVPFADLPLEYAGSIPAPATTSFWCNRINAFVKTRALKGVKVRHAVRHGRRVFIGELRWTNPPFHFDFIG